MLIEIAVGDAYGAGFEFATEAQLSKRVNDLSAYYKHGLPRAFPPGSYTDDTQMTMGIMEFMMSGKSWTIENLANKFVEVYQRDPRPGYSTKFQELLEEVGDGDELRARLIPNSDRCGAAMRSCPIGFLHSKMDIMTACQTQASITHNTTNGIVSSQAVALAVHYYNFKCGDSTELSLVQFLNTYLPNWDWTGWQPGHYVSTSAVDVTCAAISAVSRHTKMSNILMECIGYTGDVDSVAAIALGIASVNPAVENDLPTGLYIGLESGTYGKKYIETLDNNFRTFAGYLGT